jgi:drug/metabolite transporter (DMT)-like permease
MAALLLALGSAVAYGCADFLGGVAARGTHVLRVVAIAAPASLVVELVLWPVIGARWGGPVLAWGAASGVASAAAFALLYRSLAVGPMSVLSPVTALVSAVLPVAVGLALGEQLAALAGIGTALALVAVVLVSAAPDASRTRPTRTGLLLALGAGTAIAAQLVCLDQAPDDSGIAPLIVGRAVASVLVLAAAAVALRRLPAGRPQVMLGAAAGALDSLANLAFLLAAREGQLTVVAVVTALYPAATVLLARALLAERLHRTQLAGLAVGAAGVVLLALA